MMDEFMNVSMGTSRYASTPWLKLRLALLEMNDTQSRADDASRISHSSIFAIAVAAAAKRAAIPMNLPYHQTTQEHLFAQLRATVWSNDRSRIMVDLGSHAGHGRHHNLSDAMIWLHSRWMLSRTSPLICSSGSTWCHPTAAHRQPCERSRSWLRSQQSTTRAGICSGS
jgi:hypothetical protein